MALIDANYYGVGGTRTTHGSYVVHTFLNSGVFTTGREITGCYALIVAGGGSGGYSTAGWVGGGGGAGGVWVLSNFTIPIGSHPIIVGAGGLSLNHARANSSYRHDGGLATEVIGSPFNVGGIANVTKSEITNRNWAFKGEDSIAFGAVADGGGSGAGYNGMYAGGQAGGCGGGADGHDMSGSNSFPRAPTTMGWKLWTGFNGTGTGTAHGSPGGVGQTSTHNGGGGGGASEAGNADGQSHGGDGIDNAFRTGSNVSYAGGGGGGLATSATNPGGDGGGGAGGNESGSSGTDATANTGGGGGGRGRYNLGGTTPVSGAGGSGIVILRIPA
jgi:hypothetical protein